MTIVQRSIEERLAYHVFECDDCGRLIPPGQAIHLKKSNELLCTPCLRLRLWIRNRILEAIAEAPGQTLTNAQIHEDLARFGVDEDMCEAARLRLVASGRLTERAGSK